MNKLKFLFSFLIASIIVMQSCSIEKRHYTSGYHLQWKRGNSELRTKNSEVSSNSTKTFNTITASSEKKKGIVLLADDPTGCDTLIMKNGTEVKAKVLEVTPAEIKYKFCNNMDGPIYVAYRYNISYVKYANGTMDSFINEHPPVVNGNNGGYRPNNGGYNQNNRGTFNGNGSHYSNDNFATERYVANKSTRSLVLGIVSFLISIFGIISAIFAIVHGTECLRLIRQDPEHLLIYRRRAMAGVVLGIVYLGLIILIIALAILLTAGII